jgi:prefoldin subunit 5
MLNRISLIVVILAGIGAIVFGQMQVKKKIEETLGDRDRFYANWQKELARANGLEKELNETKQQLEQKVLELAAAQQELDVKNAQIAQLNVDLNRTKNDLLRARGERDQAQAKLTAYELTGLNPDEIKEVIARLKDSLENIQQLNGTIALRDRDTEGLKGRIQELVGEEGIPVILPAGLKGKVTVVDPKWDFVVINLGKNDGMLLHGQMLVSRDGKLLAKVKIVNVEETRSIANVLPGWELENIMEGDTVLY